MSLHKVRPAQRTDIRSDGDDTLDGRLLSVAEIQQVFRELRAREHSEAARPLGTARPSGVACGGKASMTVAEDVDATCVKVVAAHAGAGASTVALAIADAATAAGRATHLVETAHPTRSGLVAAASAELGLGANGAWRRGSRGQLTIHRRVGNEPVSDWPAFTFESSDFVVVDLGLLLSEDFIGGAEASCSIVVFRPTVPGVRLTEQVLTSLKGPVVGAVVGARTWPSEVNASLGSCLRTLRDTGAVVTVPFDKRLSVSGPTASMLPGPVVAAGRSLLGQIHAACSHDAVLEPPAGRRKGARQ